MGNCSSSTAPLDMENPCGEIKISRKIDHALSKARQRDDDSVRLLMLGPEGVSTSSVTEQLVGPTHSRNNQEMASPKLLSNRFCLDGIDFELCDASQLRSEPRKWISCFFDTIEAVIFVVPLSWYDEYRILPGGKRVNRMVEALENFRTLCMTFAKTTSIILLFTEIESFTEKYSESGIADQDPFMDFLGDRGQAVHGIRYLTQMFKDCFDKIDTVHTCFLHVTSESDPHLTDFVLEATQNILMANQVSRSCFVTGNVKDTCEFDPNNSGQTAATWNMEEGQLSFGQLSFSHYD
jgi:hypothetical protein